MSQLDIARSESQIVATNKVLKNTYTLLSATLFFSALMAGVGVLLALPPATHLFTAIVAMVLGMFVLPRTANTSMGLVVLFGITGLMGLGLGGILHAYLGLPNGHQIIGTAFAGTAIIFLSLSGYALMTRKDFSFLGGFLMVGMIVMLLAAVANIFLGIPALSLAISGGFILIMSGFILFDTSRMIHDPHANYIMMTFGLYLSIFNIFISLLQILGIMSSDD